MASKIIIVNDNPDKGDNIVVFTVDDIVAAPDFLQEGTCVEPGDSYTVSLENMLNGVLVIQRQVASDNSDSPAEDISNIPESLRRA